MDYKDVLNSARENLNGSCKVCKVCKMYLKVCAVPYQKAAVKHGEKAPFWWLTKAGL